MCPSCFTTVFEEKDCVPVVLKFLRKGLCPSCVKVFEEKACVPVVFKFRKQTILSHLYKSFWRKGFCSTCIKVFEEKDSVPLVSSFWRKGSCPNRGKVHEEKICVPVVLKYMKKGIVSGLGTAFFYVLNALFFCALLKHTTFFCILFSSFWRLMKPKRMMRSFAFFS